MTPSTLNIRHVLYLFILCITLVSPALFAGFMGDDHMHIALLKHGLPVSAPSDASIYGLFSFMDADPTRNKQLMDLGIIPWWTDPEMKYTFWRPLSELTHGFDNALWPGNAPLMHLHNIVWYLILSFIVLVLYRDQYKQLPGRLLLIGFALYLLDASHGFTLSWIANRNGLIATTFGISSVYAYIKYREYNSIALHLSSLAFLLLALLSAELGISSIGYIGAYALFVDKKGWFKGCVATIPHLLLVICWWIVYKSLGFGAVNADAYYLDPVASPLVFLTTLGQRLTILFGSQWGLIPAEIFGFSGGAQPITNITLIIAAVFCVIVMVVVIPLTKSNNRARFWLFGSIFSALPVCSALPHDRLLLFIGLGGVGIIIELINKGYVNQNLKANEPAQIVSGHSKPVKVFLLLFLFIHLLISPLVLPLMAYSPKIWSSQVDHTPDDLFSTSGDIENKKLVTFNVPIGSSMGIAIQKYNNDETLPKKIWPISNYSSVIKINTIDKHSLIIEKAGGFVQQEEKSVRNTQSQPFVINETIELTGLKLQVIELTKDNRPLKIKAQFDEELNDPGLLFLFWDKANKTYQQISIPSIGESVTLDSSTD